MLAITPTPSSKHFSPVLCTNSTTGSLVLVRTGERVPCPVVATLMLFYDMFFLSVKKPFAFLALFAASVCIVAVSEVRKLNQIAMERFIFWLDVICSLAPIWNVDVL